MPQAVAAVAYWAANAAGMAALAATSSITITAATSVVVYGAVEVGVYAGLALAANAMFGPKPPGTAAVQNPIKAGFVARRSGFGRARTSGTYVLFESASTTAYQVLAMHDGRVDGWERYFLHDDEVEVDDATGGLWCPSDPRKYAYGYPPEHAGDRCFIETTDGSTTETVFARPHAGLPTLWTSTHRGDGVAALSLTCKQSKQKYQQEDFPNGLPLPSAVGRFQRIYDPRDDGMTPPTDVTVASTIFMSIARLTWAWSDNPVLALMAYMTTAYGGMGLSWEQCIEPAIDDWIAAANDCDAAMDLAAGGTEKRYTLGGLYNHDSDPAEVVSQILGSFDGWIGQRGDGAFTVKSGRYAAPTVTLTDDHVTAYSVQHFTPDEQALNEVVPSYTNPDKYQTADAGAVRNEDDIAARGVVRSKTLDYGWVQSKSQGRRLAKRVLNRGAQELRGTLTTNFYGFAALGERYLQLQISENAALTDIVIEVTRIEIDLPNLALNIEWVKADPAIDDWETSEETADSTGGARPAPGALDAPTITAITPLYEKSASSDSGARLSITVTAPITADVEWLARWRVSGSPPGDWNEGSYTDIDDGASVELVTGFVTADDTLDVEVAYQTAGGTSPWSAPFSVAVSAPTTVFLSAFDTALGDALTAGTGVTITDNGDGTFTIAGAGGTVTTTGSPASGNLTKFSGASSITNGDLTGDVTTSGSMAATIANNAVTTVKINNAAVTLAKIANAAANSKLLGSGASGSGAAYSEITLGSGLTMTGTTLSSSGGGGATAFTGLSDVPASYSGAGLKLVRVNTGATALEFATLSGVLDGIGSTQGQLLYRSASGWSALNPGTLGQILSTNGAGANPSWVDSTTVTSSADGSLDIQLFGDGADGDATISSGTTTLSKDTFYNNLTISGTGKIVTNGWRLFVKGVLDITAAPAAAISWDGANGSPGNATTQGPGGAARLTSGTVGGSGAGGNGAAGGTGTGAVAPATSDSSALGGLSGAGGAGGAATSGGGASRAAAGVTNPVDLRRLSVELFEWVSGNWRQITGGMGAPGGSAGSGDGAGTTGGPGGGGGGAGGVVFVAARTINRGGSTAAGAIRTKGGNGSAGNIGSGGTNRGGGGGGAGAGGGYIYLIYRLLTGSTATNCLETTGGDGAAGANGTGTGAGGNGGGAGGGGRIDVYNVGAGTMSLTASTAAAAGNAAAGSTGGAAKSATVQQVSL